MVHLAVKELCHHRSCSFGDYLQGIIGQHFAHSEEVLLKLTVKAFLHQHQGISSSTVPADDSAGGSSPCSELAPISFRETSQSVIEPALEFSIIALNSCKYWVTYNRAATLLNTASHTSHLDDTLITPPQITQLHFGNTKRCVISVVTNSA